MRKTELSRWQTECSDCENLYFYQLHDKKVLTFSVHSDEAIYDFVFERNGPYRVMDEAWIKYDIEENSNLGWTQIVSNSVWKSDFSVALEGIYFPEGLVHYTILTWDLCLEVLSPEAPQIIKRPLIQKPADSSAGFSQI